MFYTPAHVASYIATFSETWPLILNGIAAIYWDYARVMPGGIIQSRSGGIAATSYAEILRKSVRTLCVVDSDLTTLRDNDCTLVDPTLDNKWACTEPKAPHCYNTKNGQCEFLNSFLET